MRFLRPVAEYTLLDQKRSTDIRSELKIFHLTERIESQKENRYKHILRMKTDRLPRILLKYKPRGHRSIERGRILLKSERGHWPIPLKKNTRNLKGRKGPFVSSLPMERIWNRWNSGLNCYFPYWFSWQKLLVAVLNANMGNAGIWRWYGSRPFVSRSLQLNRL
jgi:hypothetical protein